MKKKEEDPPFLILLKSGQAVVSKKSIYLSKNHHTGLTLEHFHVKTVGFRRSGKLTLSGSVGKSW